MFNNEQINEIEAMCEAAFDLDGNIEVVGNCWDNPELLGVAPCQE